MQKFIPSGETHADATSAASKRSSGRRGFVYLLIVFAVIGAAYSWWRSAAPAPSPQPHGRHAADTGTATVRAEPVTVGDMSVTLDGLGTVTSLATITVKTQ